MLPKDPGLLYLNGLDVNLMQASGKLLPMMIHSVPAGQHFLCAYYPTLCKHVIVDVKAGPSLSFTTAPGGVCTGVSEVDPPLQG